MSEELQELKQNFQDVLGRTAYLSDITKNLIWKARLRDVYLMASAIEVIIHELSKEDDDAQITGKEKAHAD